MQKEQLEMQASELEIQKDALCEPIVAESRTLYRYTTLFDFAPPAYFSFKQDSTITQLNFRGANLLGLKRSKLIGQRFLIFVTPEHRLMFCDFLENIFKTNSQQIHEVMLVVAQQTLWVSIEAHIGVSATDCFISMSDISERKQAAEKLVQMAIYDTLTNLPNAVLLLDRLGRDIMKHQPHNRSLAVAYIDLDRFRDSNANSAHNVEDRLLISVSRRMKQVLREGDTFAGVGNNKFIAIMVDLKKVEDSEPFLTQLLKAVAEPVFISYDIWQGSASMGVTHYPQDSEDAQILMCYAEQAMLFAKKTSKNHYCLFNAMTDTALYSQLKNFDEVSSAFERYEFVLLYQPKVNMPTGEVIGAEALIRWQYPRRRLIPPLDFLPTIEGHNISLELGKWIIDTALSQISQWQNLGVTLSISVNISAYQLQKSNIALRLSALLADYPAVSPHYLELEMLETNALNDITQVSLL